MHNAEEVTSRLKSQLGCLVECFAADNAESARARQMVRSLIDRITIHPAGEDDGRGCGPVRVEVEGRISSLLKCADGGDGSNDRVIQLALDTESRLNHVRWRVATLIENSDKTRKIWPLTNSDLVLDFLRTAPAPVGTNELIRHLIQSCGLDYSRHSVHMAKQRVQRCLNRLRDTGVAVFAPVPGGRKNLWALKDREREFWPMGLPEVAGNYTDTDRVMKVLRRSPGLISITEIIDQIAVAMGERPRAKRTTYLGCRVRGCLHFHRAQGTVLQVIYTGTQKQLWLLASRKDELLPDAIVQPNGTIANDASVLSILGCAGGTPVTAPDIAKAVVTSKGEMPTERNVRHATERVREHLRRFRAQGLVQEVKIDGSRFAGWLLADGEARVLPCRAKT